MNENRIVQAWKTKEKEHGALKKLLKDDLDSNGSHVLKSLTRDLCKEKHGTNKFGLEEYYFDENFNFIINSLKEIIDDKKISFRLESIRRMHELIRKGK